ncbi:MAG: DoxX family membrane protein [Dehalococcoidia bacterium]|nr:MAG: DoxX family membrane protein [Dehalococcoidia bacterium]
MVRIKAFLNSGELTLALRLLIGVLVLYAAIPKFADIEKFSVFMLYSYQFPWLMPNMAHTRILGYIAPYIETLIGFGLITGVLTRLSAAGWGLMSLVYIVVKAQVIFIQGRIIPCGCFPGPLSEMLMTQSILIDIVSLLVCTQIILARKRRFFTLGLLLPENWQYRLRYIW